MKRSLFALVLCLGIFCSCLRSVEPGENLGGADADNTGEAALSGSNLGLAAEEDAEDYVPSPGGIIRIDSRNPKTFNPVLNEELSVDRLLRLIYEPLVALDAKVKPSPGIASAWEFTPDGLSLNLHIRENAVWEDGERITAADVIYTMDVIKASPETALYHSCLEEIIGYSQTDEKTVKIDYGKPFSGALYNLTFPVIPRHHFSQVGLQDGITAPLGSGMYKLEEFHTMRDIKLTASDSCYLGKPAIPEIEVVIIRDLESSLYAYDRKLLDIVETRVAGWKKISTTRQSNIFMQASGNYEFLALNFRNVTLQNINVRRALAHSLPKSEIIDKLYAGNAFAAEAPVNPQSWLYEPDVTKYTFDAEQARTCLKLAEDDFPDGITLNILVNNDNEERMAIAELLRSTLSEIGVTCRIESFGFEDYSYRIQGGYFDIAVCGMQMPLNPDLTPMLGNVGGVRGERNFSYYKDDVMDGYLAQAEMSVFEGPQKAAYSAIQKYFCEQLPHIGILYRADVVLTGKNVYGEARPVINNAYNNIGELMIRNMSE